MECGLWITTTPSKLHGTLLPEDKMWDNMCMRYGMCPLNLQDRCNTCGKGFFLIEHWLSCKTGGLVGLGHNDVSDEAGGLSEVALQKTYVSYEPKIFQVRVYGLLSQERLRKHPHESLWATRLATQPFAYLVKSIFGPHTIYVVFRGRTPSNCTPVCERKKEQTSACHRSTLGSTLKH